MVPYLQHPELFDQILLLTAEETEKPQIVFEAFFRDYRLSELRHYLSQTVECCLVSNVAEFAEPSERADLLTRFGHFERVFEAIAVLAKRRKDVIEGSS